MVITQIVYNLKNIKPVTVLLTHVKENGFDEKFPIDNTLHSLFGVSKLSDILTQVQWKYFGMKTVSFESA